MYNVAGATIRGVTNLATVPFLVRFLGIREYGLWSLAFAILALVTMSETGISVTAAVFLSKDLASGNQRDFARTLTVVLLGGAGVSAVFGVLLWFSGPWAIQWFPDFTRAERLQAAGAIQIAGIAAAVLIVQRTLIGVEQAFERYATINFVDLLQALFINIGMVLIARSGGRSVALMKWHSGVFAFFVFVHVIMVWRLLPDKALRFDWTRARFRQVLRHSVATWIATLGSAAFGQCDRLIVGGLLGPSVLGIYAAITNVTSKINSFSASAVQPLVPALSRDVEPVTVAVSRIRQAVALNSLIATGGGICLCVMAGLVLRILAPGAATPENVLGLQVAALIYSLYSLNAPGFYVLFALGDAGINALVTLLSGVASLALIFWGAKQFGLLGAISGNAGYLGTLLLIGFALEKKRIRLQDYLGWIAVPVLCLFAAFAVGLFFGDYPWWRFSVLVALCLFLIYMFFRKYAQTNWSNIASAVPEA